MRYVAGLVALVLSLMGCGGSDGDAESPTTAPATSAPDRSDTSTASPSPEPTGGSNGDTFSPAKCPELLAWAADSVAATQAAFTGGGANAFGAEFTADYFQEFADRAPDEIRADMQTFADAYSAFFTATDELGIDFSDPSNLATLDAGQVEQLEAAAGLMDTPEVSQASDNIQAYFERECS